MIRVENLYKTYSSKRKKTKVLKDINLNVDEGICLLIKGASGTGKSTLLRVIGCLTKPSSGEVMIQGRKVSHLPEHFLVQIRRKLIGFIFQDNNLRSALTIEQPKKNEKRRQPGKFDEKDLKINMPVYT